MNGLVEKNNLYPIIPESELLPGEEPWGDSNHLEIVHGDYFLTAAIKEKPFIVA